MCTSAWPPALVRAHRPSMLAPTWPSTSPTRASSPGWSSRYSVRSVAISGSFRPRRSGDFRNENAHAARRPTSELRQRGVVATGRHDPRVGDVHVSPEQVDVGLPGGQHILYPIGLAVGKTNGQHVALPGRVDHGLVLLARRAAAVLDDRECREISREWPDQRVEVLDLQSFHYGRELHRHAGGIVGVILGGHVPPFTNAVCGHCTALQVAVVFGRG